jgi:lycopene beta-cyclase
VIDPVHRSAADRTWCWWTPAGSTGAVDRLVHRAWSRVELVDRAGRARDYDLAGLHYVMLRSPDFYAAADAVLDRWAGAGRAWRLDETVTAVEDGEQRAVVRAGPHRVSARWVLDSRPAAPARAGSITLLQHFRGWTVRFAEPVLDPGRATLMDFSVPQPTRGVAFTYCLPLDARRALVEYTEFSRAPLAPAEYDAALTGYLGRRWQVAPGRGAGIEAVEDGVIPMTDARFARVAGRRVFRIGTAGGATRPSTGYTFATMRRQADAIAAALVAGRPPVPPRPHRLRHRWMDAVLLRALDRGYLDGPDLFTGLFAANPPEAVLRFLDGDSTPSQELALMRSSPLAPMVRATAGDALSRLRRRLTSS